MGIAIALAVTQILHQRGGRVTQAQRHFLGATLLHFAHGGLECLVDSIALGRAGQIDNGLGHRQFAFRTAEAFLGLPRIQRQGETARIGVADVFRSHAHHPARNIQGVATTVQHAREPVQAGVRVRAADRFVQRRDQIVEGLTLLVETSCAAGQNFVENGAVDAVLSLRGGDLRCQFKQVERAAGITVGKTGDTCQFFLAALHAGQAPLAIRQGIPEYAEDGVFVQRL